LAAEPGLGPAAAGPDSARNQRDDGPHHRDEIARSEPELEAPSATAHVNALEPEGALVDGEGKPAALAQRLGLLSIDGRLPRRAVRVISPRLAVPEKR